MAWLLCLPNEVLVLIATSPSADLGANSFPVPVLDPIDLYHLMLMCQRLADVVEPTLYAYARDLEGSYPVAWAAERGLVGTLEAAHRHGLALDRTSAGRTLSLLFDTSTLSPLHVAVYRGRRDAVRWLLDHGADADEAFPVLCECRRDARQRAARRWGPSMRGCGHGPALHLAFCRRDEAVAILLLSRGASADYPATHHSPRAGPNQHRRHALQEACTYGLRDVVLYMMRERGADVRRCDADGGMLKYAARNPDDDDSLVRMLLAMGADVDGPSLAWRESPLSNAIRHRNLAIAHALLAAGACVGPMPARRGGGGGGGGGAPAHPWRPAPLSDCFALPADLRRRPWSAGEKRGLILDLVESGADVEERDGATRGIPLVAAVLQGNVQDAEILLEAGAKIDDSLLPNAWYSRRRTRVDELKLLMRFGASIDALLDFVDRAPPSAVGDGPLGDGPLGDGPLGDGPLGDGPLGDAQALEEILEHADHRNVTEGRLVSSLHASLRNNRFGISVVLGRHLPGWAPRPAELWELARRAIAAGRTTERPSAGWPQALRMLLSYHGLETRHLCLLLAVALHRQNGEAALILLMDRRVLDSPKSRDFLPGLLTMALRGGGLSVVRRIWRSVVVARLDPALSLLGLREAVLFGNFPAVAFLVGQGAAADPFAAPGPDRRQLVSEASRYVLNTPPSVFGAVGESDYRLLRHRVGESCRWFAESDSSPLDVAVRHGHIDVVRAFLDVFEGLEEAPPRRSQTVIPCYMPRVLEPRLAAEIMRLLRNRFLPVYIV